MSRIIMFGAGEYARDIIGKVDSISQIYANDDIVFCDNNPCLWGKSLEGREIISPADINVEETDYFVITSIYAKQISRQLIQEIKVDADRILTYREYAGKRYAQWIYSLRYEKTEQNAQKCFNAQNIVVYTAIMGEYDELKEPEYTGKGVSYVCYTNNRKLKSTNWNIEYIENDGLDNMHLAKMIKLKPHVYCKGFETSVWIDGSFQVKEDLRKYIDTYDRGRSILCFPHYQRNCIYEEAAACIYLQKGKKADIIKQISSYYRMGYPIEAGLYSLGCIVRNHQDESVQKLMLEWENELEKYSHRDQLSFPIVCWNNNYTPDICNLYIDNNPFLCIYQHK